jgi:addiction module RelB/DinJ family antitoxin
MRESTISARMDSEMKKNVEFILNKLGLSHSSAINLFYSQILMNDGLPFEMKLTEKSRKNKKNKMIAEPSVTYNQAENLLENMEDFPSDLINLLSKFGKSKKAKAAIVKLAVEFFLDELEFIEECEQRMNDDSDPLISEEEFKKRFGL